MTIWKIDSNSSKTLGIIIDFKWRNQILLKLIKYEIQQISLMNS